MSTILWLLSLPFRFLGYAFVIGAAITGFRDLWLSVKQNTMVLTSLGETWFAISPDTLNLMQAGIQRGLHPAIWDPVIVYFLMLPSFTAFLILAAIVLLIAQLLYRSR